MVGRGRGRGWGGRGPAAGGRTPASESAHRPHTGRTPAAGARRGHRCRAEVWVIASWGVTDDSLSP